MITFPIPVENLVGLRVLAIGVDRDDTRRAYVVAGHATWSPPELRAIGFNQPAMLALRGAPEALQGFNPDMLPRVLTNPAWKRVAPLARDCVAAVVGFATSHFGALELTDPFFGLAINTHTDAVFLMQGGDDE